VKKNDRAAVCFDTCHAYAAGFDLASKTAVERTMAIFDECVGFDKLRVVHLNDSRGDLGSHLDRHDNVGKGKIGVKGMKAFLHCRDMNERPLIMETPFADLKAMRQSLATVRRLMR
jgi:apurinic endonuclease APN1